VDDDGWRKKWKETEMVYSHIGNLEADDIPPSWTEVKSGSGTAEQQWMAEHWPGYQNGASLGGLFVIEDWMFRRTSGKHDPATLHLQNGEKYSNHAWSQDLLKGDLQIDDRQQYMSDL